MNIFIYKIIHNILNYKMKILEIMTAHTAPLKTLCEVLCAIIPEANIFCTAENDNNFKEILNNDEDSIESDEEAEEEAEPQEQPLETQQKLQNNNSGMKIIAIDSSKTVLINLKLDAQNFTKFKCKNKVMNLGVNLVWLYKIFKSIGKDESVTLSVDHDDVNNLNIDVTNSDANFNKKYKLKLLDLENPQLGVPVLAFEVKIIMNSIKFQKLCKEMYDIAQYVDIKCYKNKIVFSCKGDMIGDMSYEFKNNSTSEVKIFHKNKEKKNIPVIQGIYDLRILLLFSKCASLCTDIEIFMKNDFPLALKYTVATLGRILLCLTPIDNNTTQYNDENYSDEEPEFK